MDALFCLKQSFGLGEEFLGLVGISLKYRILKDLSTRRGGRT